MTLGRNLKRRLVFYPSLVACLSLSAAYCIAMPGRSFAGEPQSSARERGYEGLLRTEVLTIAGGFGERNTGHADMLRDTAGHIETALRGAGYGVTRHPYTVDGVRCETLDADLIGTGSKDIVLVGAHYDSAHGAPGADDNGSGTAAVLALARAFWGHPEKRTIRFALFTNEEPPYFGHASMGSLMYAHEVKESGDHVVAMLSLESIGYFSSEQGSQRYPGVVSLFYPDRADFVAFVGDTGARSLVRDSLAVFRKGAHVASEGAALPTWIPGVDWSDHRSFRAIGVPAIMVTDTATFRNPNYHQGSDTPDTLDYASMGKVVAGVEDVVRELATR